MTRYVRGRKRSEWVHSKGEPNEALDLCVYNLAMAHYLGLNRYRDADWARIKEQVDPVNGDLFEQPETERAPKQPTLPAESKRPPPPGMVGGRSDR